MVSQGLPLWNNVIDSSDAQHVGRICQDLDPVIGGLGELLSKLTSQVIVLIGTSLIRKFFPGTHIPVDLAVAVFFSGNCNLSAHELTLKGI